jgi:hypothetical protein
MPKSVAATFAVGLMARGALSDHDYEEIGAFLQRHFHTLSLDDQLTTIGLCMDIGRPELEGIIEAAQADPAPEVCDLAADADFPSSAPASP